MSHLMDRAEDIQKRISVICALSQLTAEISLSRASTGPAQIEASERYMTTLAMACELIALDGSRSTEFLVENLEQENQ